MCGGVICAAMRLAFSKTFESKGGHRKRAAATCVIVAVDVGIAMDIVVVAAAVVVVVVAAVATAVANDDGHAPAQQRPLPAYAAMGLEGPTGWG